MSITREDILRELELLPVWKLRQAPAVADLPVEPPSQVANQTVEVAPQKIAKQWVLLCLPSLTQTEACHTLLANIIKAMQLQQTDYVLLQEVEALTQYQAQCVLMFGMQAAHACLGISETSVESLRGKAHMLAETAYWVTHHPEQMLQNPLLKRDVWQDVCAAKQSLQK
ncbi:MAG TPA: hypothetical protein DCO68_10245 [Methylophilaceae bacterium]|nr:hypothetical protein [Methylophilaceae bacterium]